MTNLQEGGGGLSGALLRRFWLGLPIAAGGVVALLLGALVFLPQLLALQGDQKRMGQLEQMERQSLLMRGQIRASQQSADKAQAQQARLFEIVSGRGDLSTFMAMVDREAMLAGVQLDLFEPQTAAPVPAAPGAGARPPAAAPAAPPAGEAPAAGAPGAAGAAGAAGGGVIEVPGLTRESILLTARGPYPALLEFLRRLERLDVLVAQSNLKLLLEESKPSKGAPSIQTPVLKVLLSLYARPSAAAGGRAAAGLAPAPSPAPAGAAAGAAAAPAAAPAVPAR
jgi:type IV pilus assembly protein PilO